MLLAILLSKKKNIFKFESDYFSENVVRFLEYNGIALRLVAIE